MAAVAERLFPAGPKPREVWLTFGLSVLVHGLLIAGAVLVPRFQVGRYMTVPVSYTVNLVSAPPGESGGAPPAAPRAAVAPAPAPPAPAPSARPTEELTLPGRRPAAKPAPAPEPSLRPPSLPAKEIARPAVPAPAPPARVTPVVPQPGPAASAGAGAESARRSGVEVAGTARGAGSGAGAGGESALASYLTLVDWKIQQQWVPVGAPASPETVVVVRFRVLRSGQVRDVELETTSGSPSLDTSALRAVRQSLPLPPFPNLLTEPWLDLRYRFVMERG
jgi:TonB family protein